jgi:hypothetical protein|tara:strand:+ start:369 stop:584 length:216 start_codon:yes stop_codon:yes gene_type:complete
MPSKQYDHYNNLTKENLISTIEDKDNEIQKLKDTLKEALRLRDYYFTYNKFHMEEIVRLDRKIGQYKGVKE